MVERAAGRIEILPGGGIDESNVVQIVEETGASQVHAYLPTEKEDPTVLHNKGIYFGEESDELRFPVVDPARIEAVKRLISG